MLNIADAYQDERFNREYDLQTNFRTKSILAIPIIEDERCLGYLIKFIFRSAAVFK